DVSCSSTSSPLAPSFFYGHGHHPHLPSFPTRRSSDLYRTPEGVELHAVPGERARVQLWLFGTSAGESAQLAGRLGLPFAVAYHTDRKSTRLNSSHVKISYAVFCLKKKKKTPKINGSTQ